MPWDQIQGCLQPAGDSEQQVATLKCLPAVFASLVNAALIFAGVTAVIFIIIGGIKMINSGGDQKQLEGARKTITFAIIGLVLILSSFFIIQLIAYFTGTSCITAFGLDACNK